MKINIALLTFSVICGVVTPTPDYYWRPFDGSIPADALPAAINGAEISYIGNAPVYEGGLYIGQLVEGTKEINVTGSPLENGTTVHTKNELIHILCTGQPEMFEWIETNTDHVLSIPYHKVEGGYEKDNTALLHIGRINYYAMYIIGKVTDYGGPGNFWFFDGEKETESHNFEVLVYKEIVHKNRTL